MSQCEPDGSRGFHGIKGSDLHGSSAGRGKARREVTGDHGRPFRCWSIARALRVSASSVLGYWLLATGYWLLATGYWLLATGYWLLATGYWLRRTLLNGFRH